MVPSVILLASSNMKLIWECWHLGPWINYVPTTTTHFCSKDVKGVEHWITVGLASSLFRDILWPPMPLNCIQVELAMNESIASGKDLGPVSDLGWWAWEKSDASDTVCLAPDQNSVIAINLMIVSIFGLCWTLDFTELCRNWCEIFLHKPVYGPSTPKMFPI